VRLAVTAAVCALVALAAACGGDDDDDGTRPSDPAVDLTIVVWPEGPDGRAERHRIVCVRLGSQAAKPRCRELAGLEKRQLDPVPPDTACTQIYGGPAEARVRGTLPGGRVDTRFARTDGCQIERWDRNRVLLGD
jgi:hypothetical protein